MGDPAYLYGIVRRISPSGLVALGAGVGNAPVKSLAHREVVALVGEVDQGAISREDIARMRRDMKAHAAVLQAAAAKMTVLPARYGLIFPGAAALVARLLEPHYHAIDTMLNKLNGAVEVTLRATYVEPAILREVVAANPALARAGREADYHGRIEVGKRISAEIHERARRDSMRLIRKLKTVIRDVRLNESAGELTVLNAALLVDREGMDRFDQALTEINREESQRMQFDCVGPLPVYSFVDLRI